VVLKRPYPRNRSAGLVVRWNWNRQLDLVDAEASPVLVNDRAYHKTFVYGNILIERDDAGNAQIGHEQGGLAPYPLRWKGRNSERSIRE